MPSVKQTAAAFTGKKVLYITMTKIMLIAKTSNSCRYHLRHWITPTDLEVVEPGPWSTDSALILPCTVDDGYAISTFPPTLREWHTYKLVLDTFAWFCLRQKRETSLFSPMLADWVHFYMLGDQCFFHFALVTTGLVWLINTYCLVLPFTSSLSQRRREVRWHLPDQRGGVPRGQLSLCPARHL